MSWWEQGALGLTYLSAPAWVHQAFGVISSARSRAGLYHAELRRAAKG